MITSCPRLSVIACCGVVLFATPSSVMASVAEKLMLDGESIVTIRDRGVGSVFDFVQNAWGWTESECADGRSASKFPFVRPMLAHG